MLLNSTCQNYCTIVKLPGTRKFATLLFEVW